MAYALKVLEKGTADTIDASTVVGNLYTSETTGYTGAGGTATYVAASHSWTMTGSAARVDMNWSYTTTTACADGKKVFYRAKVMVDTANMTDVRLLMAGTTSGIKVLTSRVAPAAGTWYDLHIVTTLSGLVGNIKLFVDLNDNVSVTGVVLTIKDWVAIDLTTIQGAGNESSDASIYAYILWRQDGWEWIDWYRYASGFDHCYRWERIDGHGLTTGDVRHDISATPAALGEWSSVYVIDEDWVAVGHIWALGTSAGDDIDVYVQTDRTSRILAQSLRLNLRSDIEAEVTCDMYGDATWQPLCGMTVMIYDGTELLHTGKITSISRRRYEGAQAWKCSVRIGTMSEVMLRATYDLTNLLDNYSTRGAIERLLLYAVNGSPDGGYGSGLAILHGRIDLGLADIGEFDQTGKTVSQMISELASAAGLIWYVDKYRKLNVRTPLVTPADAAHALVDGNGYTDYREVEYTQTTDQYRTRQIVTGGFDDSGDPVIATQFLTTPPISVDVEACGNEYTAIARNDSLEDSTDAATSADANLRVYGAQVPCTISFESGSTDWRPNTKLTVHLDYLGITSDTYFNIDSVELYDIDGVHIRSRVTASQRDGTTFASVPNSGASAYLSDLQTKAQNSVNSVHNGDTSAVLTKHWFTPEGGIAVRLTNKTGGATVHGTMVAADTTTDNAFKTCPANSDTPIGFSYGSGVADGGEAWVVILGIAEVLMKNTVAPVKGYVGYVSDTAGRVNNAATIPGTTEHWREIGHCLESKAGGTNVLAKFVLHFN